MTKTFKDLERCFYFAIVNNKKYVACSIQVYKNQKPEIIINEHSNLSDKFNYLRELYNDDLTHKHSDSIKILDFMFSDSFEEIERKLVT